MAARENQGLQIALIIFVTLTVLLSLTTFVFFRNYQNEQQKANAAQKDAGDANQALANAKTERDKLVQFSGLPAPDDKKTGDDAMKDAADAWDKDMKAFQALRTGALPDDEKTYRKMIAGLQSIIGSQHTALEKQASDLRDAKVDFDRKATDYDTKKKDLEEEKNKAVADYLAERASNTEHVKKLEDSQQGLSATLQKRDKEMEAERNDLHGKLAERDKSIDTLRKQLKSREAEMKDLHGKFAVNSQPSGKIVWVDQRNNIAYINLGSEDLLHKRVTFAVFDQNTTDPTAVHNKKQGISATESENQSVVSEAKPKGVLEVIDITQPHLAECRILQDTPSNPLLPGDMIYTPLWRPGQPAHFALVGFFDLDAKGVNEIQRIREIVRTNGGIIDAETDEKGNVKGALTPTTRYVVEADTNQHDGFNGAGVTTLLHDADTLGVEVIDLAKFLDMMGYSTNGTLESAASKQRVRIPEAGEPNTNFQPRTPQERNRAAATQTSS
ncbi:MAG TPA: hypothetical protein VFE46_12180 [Pirellulales bacterium]|jgi:hypothetical protein|nr:hypothetical protein [Pirellulales bacterium]